MNEAVAENWSTRQLERQISVLYYDRMLKSIDKQSVKDDAQKI
jgi:predicted nuclease of restriction endonuclease-like (RecB) superfamily